MSRVQILHFIITPLLVLMLAAESYAAVEAQSTLHGQFRINSYYQDSGKDGTFGKSDDIQSARLRFRPTWDLKFDSGIAVHMQLNIGHINSNIANARYTLNGSSAGDPAVSLRHGYISAPVPGYENWTIVGGIIPISDKFGDTLFSSDWDYNPLAFELIGNLTGAKVMIAHANLDEGAESSHPADDIDQWIVEIDTEMGVGLSYYALNDNSKPTNSVTGASQTNEHYVGIRYMGGVNSTDFNAFAIYNWGKRKVTPTGANPRERKNSGVAVKGEVKAPLGPVKVGLMALYASGDKDFADATKEDSNSFITPMSIVSTTGYWGYTGKINVQGPTDTGIDSQAVNIDGADYASGANLGRGMTTVQINAGFPIIKDRLEGYAAAAWFRSNDAPSGQSKSIGTDLYAQAKYIFGNGLNLEAGVDYVALGKGHPDNISANESRNITLVFSRFQLEF